MEKEVRFRILNKTSKTVTVKLGGKPMEFPWDEFNKKLVVVDKFWAVLNEEEKKKQDKAEELISNAVVAMMIQNGNGDAGTKLTHLAVLGKCIDDAAELLECSRLEVMQLIRKRLMLMNPFMVNPMFDDETLKRNHMYRKKETVTRQFERETSDYRSIKNNKNETGGQYGSHTPTFGDAFSSLLELKEKLKK